MFHVKPYAPQRLTMSALDHGGLSVGHRRECRRKPVNVSCVPQVCKGRPKALAGPRAYLLLGPSSLSCHDAKASQTGYRRRARSSAGQVSLNSRSAIMHDCLGLEPPLVSRETCEPQFRSGQRILVRKSSSSTLLATQHSTWGIFPFREASVVPRR
jgi:hypothetical protein